jgi:mycothiol S-conjugate amidase
MPDTEPNAHPDNFANAPLDEAVGRLARLIRLERPHVVITYGEDQSRYPHPDHLRVHEITAPAVERAADETWEPDGDRPWQVQKIYWSNGFTRARLLAIHGWFIQNGQESPFEEWISKIPEDADDRVTTRVDVSGHLDVARDALRAHKTQVASDSFFFRVPVEELREIHFWEEYELAWSLFGRGPADEHGFETDLFAGIPD